MVTMSQNVGLEVQLDGGVGTACCRSCCASESAFMTTFRLKPTATGGEAGDVLLSPAVPGEIILLNLDGKTEWRIQKGSFLCADESIHVGASPLAIFRFQN